MRERPILFSGPLVRALLAGTKTQTRRLMKPQPEEGAHMAPEMGAALHEDHWGNPIAAHACPYGKVGDRLWVRETWGFDSQVRADFKPALGRYDLSGMDLRERIVFRADESGREVPRWRPAIHMPRWASRITLEVTEVRSQRLQDISEEDAKAEGITGPYHYSSARAAFECVWDTINGKRASWESNPFVWAISFRRI